MGRPATRSMRLARTRKTRPSAVATMKRLPETRPKKSGLPPSLSGSSHRALLRRARGFPLPAEMSHAPVPSPPTTESQRPSGDAARSGAASAKPKFVSVRSAQQRQAELRRLSRDGEGWAVFQRAMLAPVPPRRACSSSRKVTAFADHRCRSAKACRWACLSGTGRSRRRWPQPLPPPGHPGWTPARSWRRLSCNREPVDPRARFGWSFRLFAGVAGSSSSATTPPLRLPSRSDDWGREPDAVVCPSCPAIARPGRSARHRPQVRSGPAPDWSMPGTV